MLPVDGLPGGEGDPAYYLCSELALSGEEKKGAGGRRSLHFFSGKTGLNEILFEAFGFLGGKTMILSLEILLLLVLKLFV